MLQRHLVLGYPTKTAAVLALRKKGLLTREIATEVGISMKSVTALEASARRHRGPPAESKVGSIRMAKLSDYFPVETIQALRPDAAMRGWSVDLLIKEVVTTVAASGLVNAVMDDADERAGR